MEKAERYRKLKKVLQDENYSAGCLMHLLEGEVRHKQEMEETHKRIDINSKIDGLTSGMETILNATQRIENKQIDVNKQI